MRGRGLDPLTGRARPRRGAARRPTTSPSACGGRPTGGLALRRRCSPNLAAVVGDTAIPLALPTGDALDDAGLDAIESLIGLLAPLAPPWLSSIVGLLGWASWCRHAPGSRSSASLGSGADPAAVVGPWLAPALGQFGPDALSLLADLLAGDGAARRHGRPARARRSDPFELALSSDGSRARPWPSGSRPPVPSPAHRRPATSSSAGVRARPGWRPTRSSQALEAEAAGRRRRRRPHLEPGPERRAWTGWSPAGAVATGASSRRSTRRPAWTSSRSRTSRQARSTTRSTSPTCSTTHPPVTFHVRIAASADGVFPDAPAERVVDLTAGQPGARDVHRAGAGQRRVVRRARDPRRAAGWRPVIPTGRSARAARLARLVDAFERPRPGPAARGRMAGPARPPGWWPPPAATVSDVVTVGTPYGPVSLTVLDEAAAGDAWRLLQDLLFADSGADDAGPGPRAGAGRRAGRGRRQRRSRRGAAPAGGRHPRSQRPEGARGLRRGHRAGGARRDHGRRGLGPGRPGDAAGGRGRAAACRRASAWASGCRSRRGRPTGSWSAAT